MSPEIELRAIAARLSEVGKELRVPSQRGPLIGAWTQLMGAMSDTCEGLADLVETLGREPDEITSPSPLSQTEAER